MPRYAYKVYYDGRKFFGYQWQPTLRTVEDELLRALTKTRCVSTDPNVSKFASAGRTDRFVSALGNVFAVNVERVLPPCAINSALSEDVRIWASAEVSASFNPRRALRRHYKYFAFANEEADLNLMSEASRSFIGTHDFRNFAYRSHNENYKREILSISIRKLPDSVVCVSIVGDSFLHRMARRIVGSLLAVASGSFDLADVEALLDSRTVLLKRGAPSALPEGLVLWDVEYGFPFTVDAYAMGRLLQSFSQSINESAVSKMVFTEFKEYLNSRSSLQRKLSQQGK